MNCPECGQRRELVYDSASDYRKRMPFDEWRGLDHLPRPHTVDRPPTSLPQAHYMLAWDDFHRQYYIYSKCIWPEDAILMANAMVGMQLATHIEVYEARYEPYQREYICQSLLFVIDGIQPARTLQQQWTDFMHMFRCLVTARGYTPRIYYDDVDEDLPVTSHTIWRPRRPKNGRGWFELLNLKTTYHKS